MRKWKELLFLLTAISVLARVLQLTSPTGEGKPSRIIAEGCIEVGATLAEIDANLRAQGWQAMKEYNLYVLLDRDRDRWAAWWQLYFRNDRLTGAVGGPGRLFLSPRRILLTEFDRASVIRALEGCPGFDARRARYGVATFYPGGEVGLGEHERP